MVKLTKYARQLLATSQYRKLGELAASAAASRNEFGSNVKVKGSRNNILVQLM